VFAAKKIIERVERKHLADETEAPEGAAADDDRVGGMGD
jgi:hypothetical protein